MCPRIYHTKQLAQDAHFLENFYFKNMPVKLEEKNKDDKG